MVTTIEQINTWLNTRSENQSLEFKEAKTQFDRNKLFQYCVAIANEGGGHLLLGISDSPPRKVIGTAAFPNLNKITENIFHKIGFRVDVEEVNHPDGRILIFQIPSRLRGSAYNLDGRYLMRSGSELISMSEDRLRNIFSEGQPDWLEEESISDLTGQEVLELLDTSTFFKLLHLPHPSECSSVLGRLVNEQLIEVIDDRFTIKNIGSVLIARDLGKFPKIKRKAPRVILYSGTNKNDTISDLTGNKGYAVGFQGLIKYLIDKIPHHERINKGLRTKVNLIPEIAIRELTANALIHQDFNLSGISIMVEIFSNRIEFSNPGEPILPVERFIDGYQSRNERLADLMRRMGICEERSSGIDKVISAVEELQLPAPDFRSGLNRTSAIVYGPKPFDEMTKEERIRACYQHCALKYVESRKMTNQSLRERFRLSNDKSAIVSQVILATQEANFIKIDESSGNSRKFAKYIPIWA